MKNRKLIYFLLPLSIIVWSMVIVQVVRHFKKPGDTNEIVQGCKAGINAKSEADTFRLQANYPDPFLGHNLPSGPRENIVLKEIRKFSIQNSSKTFTQWSDIKYSGMILNKNNNQQVYLLKVNDKNYLLRKGEKAGTIELKGAYKDSIIVSLNNEYKTIKKTIL
jgi:hypothetical protein